MLPLTDFAFLKKFAFPRLLFLEDVENKTSEAAKHAKSLPCLHIGGFVVFAHFKVFQYSFLGTIPHF